MNAHAHSNAQRIFLCVYLYDCTEERASTQERNTHVYTHTDKFKLAHS